MKKIAITCLMTAFIFYASPLLAQNNNTANPELFSLVSKKVVASWLDKCKKLEIKLGDNKDSAGEIFKAIADNASKHSAEDMIEDLILSIKFADLNLISARWVLDHMPISNGQELEKLILSVDKMLSFAQSQLDMFDLFRLAVKTKNITELKEIIDYCDKTRRPKKMGPAL